MSLVITICFLFSLFYILLSKSLVLSHIFWHRTHLLGKKQSIFLLFAELFISQSVVTLITVYSPASSTILFSWYFLLYQCCYSLILTYSLIPLGVHALTIVFLFWKYLKKKKKELQMGRKRRKNKELLLISQDPPQVYPSTQAFADPPPAPRQLFSTIPVLSYQLPNSCGVLRCPCVYIFHIHMIRKQKEVSVFCLSLCTLAPSSNQCSNYFLKKEVNGNYKFIFKKRENKTNKPTQQKCTPNPIYIMEVDM